MPGLAVARRHNGALPWFIAFSGEAGFQFAEENASTE
jgi:hypothetical protein